MAKAYQIITYQQHLKYLSIKRKYLTDIDTGFIVVTEQVRKLLLLPTPTSVNN